MNEIFNSQINDSSPILWLTKGIIQFNDINLTSLKDNSTWYIVKSGNELSLNNAILEEYVSEIIDWWTIIDKRYGNKWVPFTLFIQGSDYSDLITKIQALKQWLNEKNWKLYITRAGITYTFTATCNNIVIPDFNVNEDFVDNVQISFIFTSPHWIVEEPEVTQLSEITDFEKIITNSWNYKSYPKIIFIWKSWSTITDINIELKKVWDISWESLFINEWINDWDVLIADYNEKTVTINDVEIPFDWFMTPLEVWMNVFDFIFTWTVNLDVYILYNKTYL